MLSWPSTVTTFCRLLARVAFVGYMLLLGLMSADPPLPRRTAAALLPWIVVAAAAALAHRITSRGHWPFRRGPGVWISAFLASCTALLMILNIWDSKVLAG